MDLTKEQAVIDMSELSNIHIIHGGGCWWGVAPVK